MISVPGYEGRRILVFGMGRSGLAAARALRAGGAQTMVWDDSPEARTRAEAEGFALCDPLEPDALVEVSALIVSPGIPHLYPEPSPAVTAAVVAGVPVDNDIGLFFRSHAARSWDRFDHVPRVVAVTGSNGKSTTSALIHHILEYSERRCQLAGNIGRGVLDLDPLGDREVVVLELSSYQTDLARMLTPDIAVFTNLTPDHLDRHGGIGGYFAAKRRLFVEGAPSWAVIGVDEPEGRLLANQLSACPKDDRVIRVSSGGGLAGPGWTVCAPKGILSERRRGNQVASIDLRNITSLSGGHNHQNACAAYAAVRALGLGSETIGRALHAFEGLPHRSQIVAQAGGVTYVNDSKATNVDSAARALQAFASIRWIAGGLGKENGIAGLKVHLGSVVKAYLIGHSAREFALQVGGTPHEVCGTMERAVAKAMEEAKAGDTVLLAPAAASFDQYPDFEARGEAFIAAVKARL